ncbi:MAG: glycosyltransferase [Puniceicoccales bacterium]|jgi:glycosyltransferase involved in cell wall biosynthesis|nr:glycosyltransferase [Puniceicoccales bacterium]
MKALPKVSIIVPIYGVEKYLRQCLDSILAQTLKWIEIILVDDGSLDKCPQIVDEYAAQDRRIVAIHQANGGYGKACNTGLGKATGEYVAIVEADDFIVPDMYKILYAAAKKHNVDVVKSAFNIYFDIPNRKPKIGGYSWFSSSDSPYKKPWKIFTITEHPEFFYFHPSIWSCIYRRDFIEKHRIRIEEIPGAGWTDNLFQVQTLCLAESIFYIEKPLYYWRLAYGDDALSLKDFTIPFKRTKTIHRWLNSQNIFDENVWACLYKRELAYIHNVLRAIRPMQLKKAIFWIRECIGDMDPKVINANKFINETERKQYRRAHSCYYYYYYRWIRRLNSPLKKVSHFILSIRIRKCFWFVNFLGIQIGSKESRKHPHFTYLKLGNASE